MCSLSSIAFADPLRVREYDGDTGAPTVRWTIDADLSFDTPETSYRFGAKCDLEIDRGKAATKRVRELQRNADSVELEFVYDEDGKLARTDDGRRLLAARIVDGENLGHILAREGHAMIYHWRSETVDWCATPPVKLPRVK